MSDDLESLLAQVRACRICDASLPLGPKPVLQVGARARLLIVGHAPGVRVHATGIPWNDPSGERLRAWLDMDKDIFYDVRRIAIMATGLCYPGRGPTGDLPPRPECAPTWHPRLRTALPDIRLTLLLGQYAQAYYLKQRRGKTLTATVRTWRDYLPDFLPLPHPSPRNQLWFKRKFWFEEEILPALQAEVRRALGD